MVDDRTALMSARALSPGYEVLWYTIDSVLGQGGFGITYLAHDRNLDRSVAIKEYLPTSFAYRHQDYSVKPITGDHRKNFAWGLDSFLKEAQTLARFSHPNVVRVHSVFEENNTAYMVMEYEHGQNLATIYKEREHLDQPFFEQVFFPIFDGLKEIHKFDFIHRDIKPANIYIREDGTPVLIDFGSARQTTQQQTSEITTLVSQGYTPLEQYSANYGDQGPWTDIYALAATIYEGVIGSKPDESLSRSACLMRSKPDLLEQLSAQAYPGFSQQFLDAVFAGLKLEPEGRPQSLEAWCRMFEKADRQHYIQQEGSGFTELESDRTRLQPRRPAPQPGPAADDSFTDPDLEGFSEYSVDRSRETHRHAGSTDEPLYTSLDNDIGSGTTGDSSRQRRQQGDDTIRAEFDELLDFDDDDFPPISDPGSARSTSARSPHTDRQPKKRTGLILTLLGALILAGVGGAYFFLGSGTSDEIITVSALSSMPGPSRAVATELPKESALAELADMASLAPLLAQAYALNANDPKLQDTIRATETRLLILARKWNATNHVRVAEAILGVSYALPVAVHDPNRIRGLMVASEQVSAYNQVLKLIEGRNYLQPAGDSVLDRITTVSANEYRQLTSTPQWQQMIREISKATLDKLANAQFEDAARLTEAALTIEPGNADFNAMRTFLNSES